MRFLPHFKSYGWAVLTVLGLFACFMATIKIQDSTFQPVNILQSFKDNGTGLVLKNWSVSLFNCDSEVPLFKCDTPFSKPVELSFPNTQSLRALVEAEPTKPNRARMSHRLSEAETAWLKKQKNVTLVFPRSVQSRAMVYGLTDAQGSLGATLSFFSPADLYLNQEDIQVEFDFDGLPFFGPMDTPPLLVAGKVTGLAQSISTRLEALGGFYRQLVLSGALIMALLSLILDTSILFRYLGTMAFFFGSRSFFWTLVETGQIKITPPWQMVSSILTAGYCFSLVAVAFAFAKDKHPHKKTFFGALILATLLSVLPITALSQSAFVWDELCEFTAAIFSTAVVIVYWPQSAVNPTTLGTLGLPAKKMKLSALVVLLAISAYANGADAMRVYLGQTKDLGHWGHTLFHPLLLCLGFFQVGLVSKQVKQAAQALLAKAKQDKDLQEGRDYQHAMLPSLRNVTDVFQWRAWYKPATSLAGDWLDVREVKMNDGQTFLMAIVCDVTGHGTRSALTTSVLSSHWAIGCAELKLSLSPQNHEERSELLSKIMARLDQGISSGQTKGICTAVSVILDPQANKGTMCSFGHPTMFKFSSGALHTVLAPSNLCLGENAHKKEFDSIEFELASNETLCLYSDGLFAPGDSVKLATFVKSTSREMKLAPVNVAEKLLKQLRNVRKIYRSNSENEDDISLMLIGFSKNLELHDKKAG